MYQLVLNFKLDIFEGPLDLLLYLIRKNEFDIFDIPIAEITAQYLEYLKVLEQIGIDTLADYMAMAALLMEIKSRMLLPREEKEGGEEERDPRKPLVDLLLTYQAFQEAAEELGRRPQLGRDEFTRPYKREEAEAPLEELSPYELVRAFLQVLSRKPSVALHVEPVDVVDKVRELTERLSVQKEILFSELVRGKSRLEKGVYFLALLDVVFRGVASAYQERLFGEIHITPRGVSHTPRGQVLTFDIHKGARHGN